MPTYTVTLSDPEQKAMEYISTDVDFWIQNAVHERARLAMDEMAATHVKTELAAGNSVSGSTVEEIVMSSELPSAQARNQKMMDQMVPPEEMIGTKR